MILVNGEYRHFNIPKNQIVRVDLTGAVYLIKRVVIERRACNEKERSKMTFIYPPTIVWGKLFQRPQQLMRAFAKLGHTSYFCSSGLAKDASPEPNLHVIGDVNRIPKLTDEPRVLWVSFPPNIDKYLSIPHDILVFDALDEPSEEFKHWKKGYDVCQKRADAVFAVSDSLCEYNKEFNPTMLPNGCDFEHFGKYANPACDMISGSPVIGFYGAVASWLDWEIINYCIEQRPEYSFVFVGPGYSRSLPANTKNSFFLGERSYSSLPKYLYSFDVAIIPFEIKPMTLGCDPIKCYEYLASGIPVVSTPIPQVVKLAPAVRIGSTKEEFLAQIDDAVANPDLLKKERIALARENSWEARAKTAIKRLEELL
jgi:glycosyltransferase involved in cell wall biosynthesis